MIGSHGLLIYNPFLVLILMVTNRSFHFSASTLTTDYTDNVISCSGTSVGVQLSQVCIAISMSGH